MIMNDEHNVNNLGHALPMFSMEGRAKEGPSQQAKLPLALLHTLCIDFVKK